MEVGYAVLYTDGTLVISKYHTILSKKIEIDYGKFEDTCVPWKRESAKIKKVRILDQVKTNCMKAWFGNCMNLLMLIDFENLDVSNCIDFSYMFDNCKSLQDLNELQNWNVFNGKSFKGMFLGCTSLQNLNILQNWNISNETNFSYMFSYCTLLKEIYLSNTLSILRQDMFFNCNEDLKIHWKNHIYTYEDLLAYEEIS